jgi:Sulfatase-modifying factor enzyme 1
LDDLISRSIRYALALLLAACAGSTGGAPSAGYVALGVDAGTPPTATNTEGDATAPAAPNEPAARSSEGGLARAEGDGGASTTDPKDDATKSAACADGMVLIDGDYCTNLEMTCLKSTYAPQNKKTICWDFKEPTACVGPKEHKRFCIDRYEYPNKKGERPRVMIDFPQAQQLCADQGKRLCTETEWTTACEGPAYKPYPYGYHRDPKICNGDQQYGFPDLHKAFSKDPKIADPELARLYMGVPSGSQPQCVSDYGVYDMPGNADEMASSETYGARSEFDSVTTGGPWLEGVRNQCRPKIYTHNEGFAYYYLSFRCCAEPDGKPSDPRSPKQIKRKQQWRKVNVPPQISPPPASR